ncbi:transcriptional regulator [Cellulomonas sp. NS3]|uniref:transcriptional regulator n=1 Tax=Cellulomonas sp. NS3 TaxID=2973977 RepID=UPI0021619C15|nr:transcriptional regulator [Cellulomonas sp. NS3]
MSSNLALPDYPLDDLRVVTARTELAALSHPLRDTLLDLLLERAATVGELATAVGRPPSTVAYHVHVLLDAGLLRVVRTRRVRAIEERFYGRTARIFYIGQVPVDALGRMTSPVADAAAESAPAHHADTLRAILRHARIPRERAAEFWDRVFELTREFSALPRGGETTYGFVAGLYPTTYPSLPDPADAADEVGGTDGSGTREVS